MQERLFTVEQVAEYLGVHRDTVYAMVRSGRLKAFQLGGRKASWRITAEDLQAFISQRRAAQNGGDAVVSDDFTRRRELNDFDSQQRADLEAFRARQAGDRREFVAGQEETLGHRTKNA